MKRKYIDINYICKHVCTQKNCIMMLCPIGNAPVDATIYEVADMWIKNDNNDDICPECGAVRVNGSFRCSMCNARLYDEFTKSMYEAKKIEWSKYGEE